MNFYEVCLSDKTNVMKYEKRFTEINKKMGAKIDEGDNISFYIYDGDNCFIHAIMSAKIEKVEFEKCKAFILKCFSEKFGIEGLSFEYAHEITLEEFTRLGIKAYNNGFINRWGSEACEIGIDFTNNRTFKYDDRMLGVTSLTKESILKKAESIMADKSLLEEIERIYSTDNLKEYRGNPVHYRINATNKESATEIINILAMALVSNNRLVSRRVNRMYAIKDGCYADEDVCHVFSCSAGAMLTEGTMIGARSADKPFTEQDLQDWAIDFFKTNVSLLDGK